MLSRIFNFVPSWSLIISSDLKLGSSLNSICLSKIIAGLLFSEIFFELFAIIKNNKNNIAVQILELIESKGFIN